MARREALHDDARAAMQGILEALPADHPARAAYAEGADATELMSLVDREDVAERLNQAWLDWYAGRVRQQRRAQAA